MRALAPIAFVVPAVAAATSPLPSGVVPAGQAKFTWFGFDVYHARLWVAPQFRRSSLGEAALALELTYERSFKANDIASRSLVEMARQGPIPEPVAQRWEQQLRAALVDVRAGDKILGVLRPGRGVELYGNGRPLGAIEDTEFARRFFGIWLGPHTSEPRLRDELLAGTPP